VAGLVLFLLLAVGGYAALRGPQTARLPADSPSVGSTTGGSGAEPDDVRGDAASALLQRLAARLEHGSAGQVAALAAPGDPAAARELRQIRANVRAIGITDLSLRYVDEDGGRVPPDRQRAYHGQAWVGNVQLTWRIRGFEANDSHLETTVTLVRTAGGAAFATARGGYGSATPLWLLEPVSVRRSPTALVVTTRHDHPARFTRLADQAVVDVRKVLPSWRGRLVVEVPGRQVELARVLGSAPGAYNGIAAVTTTADGSRDPRSPVHIFVNPRVFDPLGPRGSQIVMSHEATHVATGAATSSMPTWLLEGFADYVALAHADLPVSVTASQILAQVRRKGPPGHLPGHAEFDPTNTALGASYEAAWLACRLLGQEYGQRRLIEFYRQSDRLSSTRQPFRSVLHTDQARFTRAWQRYLRSLAG
jgi:hypothetical protein